MDRLELETIYNQSVTAMQMVVNSDCRELAANNMTIMLGEVNQTSGEVYCGHKDMCFNSSMGFTVDHFIWEKEFNVFANTTAGCTCNHTVDEFCAWAELALEDHEAKIKDTLLNMRSTVRALRPLACTSAREFGLRPLVIRLRFAVCRVLPLS